MCMVRAENSSIMPHFVDKNTSAALDYYIE